MSMKDIFGFGKKEKKQDSFRIPQEIIHLRMKIASEAKENYPSSTRFDELVRDADAVYSILHALMGENSSATDAKRIKEDIDAKLSGLKKIIDKNKQESKQEGKDDYVESNIDYIVRKNMRNKAKTLFISILEEIESFEKYCREGQLERGKTIESETADLFKNVLELHNNYFMQHGKDKEIQGIKLEIEQRLAKLNVLFNENKAVFQEKGLAANFEAGMKHILGE